MSEAKRIEGRMFLRGGVGWTVAVLALLVLAAGTLLVGYLVNRWVAFTSGAGTRMMLGAPAIGGAAAAGGAVWTGPVAGGGAIPVDSVPWPVTAERPFREHWEKRQPGIGTLFSWYMDPASPSGWQSSTSISIPVKGEASFVLVVSLPRGIEPPDAPGGQIWVCRLGRGPAGDIMPDEQTTIVRARLSAAQLKYVWENGVPPKLQQDLIDAANGTGPLFGRCDRAGGVGALFTPIDEYFVEEAMTEEP